MKIAVIGGSGFLGSHLCDLLSSKGHEVNIFDIKKSKYRSKNQKMYIGSILDKKGVVHPLAIDTWNYFLQKNS